MKLESLNDALIHELRDLYSAEKQLTKALPKMAEGANHPDLASGFQMHMEETLQHIKRLEGVFEDLGVSPGREKCLAMAGLIEEGSKVLDEDGSAAVKDALLISAAQRVEHYEIAAYGSAVAFADQLGLRDVAQALSLTLEEEKATDEKLTALSEEINLVAAAPDAAKDAK